MKHHRVMTNLLLLVASTSVVAAVPAELKVTHQAKDGVINGMRPMIPRGILV